MENKHGIRLTDVRKEYKGMCYCQNCEGIFSEDETGSSSQCVGEYWGTPAYETFSVCPYCGDDSFVDIDEYLADDILVDGTFENVFTVESFQHNEFIVCIVTPEIRSKLEGIETELEKFMHEVIGEWGLTVDEFVEYFKLVYSKKEHDCCLYCIEDDGTICEGFTQNDVEVMGFRQLAEIMRNFMNQAR